MQYGYCRVSTKGQLGGNSIDEQRQSILTQYPGAHITVESFSGAKERPLFGGLLQKLKEGDVLIVTKLDRFCRTAKEGLGYVDQLLSKGVRVHILNMGLIEDTPIGRMTVTHLLAFAEFERAMIMERTQAGKAIAKTKDGYREGRPKKFKLAQLEHALSLLEANSYGLVESMTGISKSTLVRAKKERGLI